ncbi:MAG: recombinase family protein, partial [Proteobacteria bacterium]|nr:recombinase family protein [Pseudomonadota bacterium]
TMHVCLLGTMAQLYLSDLKEKTLRGQLGRALAGKIPGGKAYGYQLVEGERGERQVDEAEALVIRRIFREFAAGTSPRAIAKVLNAERIPGPVGRQWRDTTIRGQVDRGTGILNNSLYVGRLEWNRCSYIKNPKTGKRIARPNPPEDWEIVPAPDLRIIDDELWDRVKERQRIVRKEMTRATGQPLNSAHRRHFLLSGLLECGHCGGGYTIMGRDRCGCATRRSKGTCENSRTVTRQDVEARVLEGLKHRLMAPELLKAFVDEYRKEVNRLASENAASRADLKNQLARTERRIAGILKAIEDGKYNATLTDRLTQLEEEREKLRADLEQSEEPSPLRLHPKLAEIYAQKVADLEKTLTDPSIREEAAEILRGLIDRIEVHPRPDRGADLHLFGDLANIIALADETGTKKLPNTSASGSQTSVVAGARYLLYRNSRVLPYRGWSSARR